MRKKCLGPQPQITDQGLCWWVDWRRLHHVKWSFHTRAAAAAAESCLICARTCTEILYVPENPVGWNGWLSVNEREASIDFKMVKLFSLGNTEDKANRFDGQYSCSGGLWENGSSTETVASCQLSGKDGGSRENVKIELILLMIHQNHGNPSNLNLYANDDCCLFLPWGQQKSCSVYKLKYLPAFWGLTVLRAQNSLLLISKSWCLAAPWWCSRILKLHFSFSMQEHQFPLSPPPTTTLPQWIGFKYNLGYCQM